VVDVLIAEDGVCQYRLLDLLFQYHIVHHLNTGPLDPIGIIGGLRVKGDRQLPNYMYRCYDCNKDVHEVATISKRSKTVACPGCNKQIEQCHDNPNRCDGGDKPRVSQAMAIRPEDIPVAMQKWPGSRYRDDGALHISGRTEKKIRMKQRNLVEY
jgi:DNA-directed RNA polymerase subunit RPC12/RpoP